VNYLRSGLPYVEASAGCSSRAANPLRRHGPGGSAGATV